MIAPKRRLFRGAGQITTSGLALKLGTAARRRATWVQLVKFGLVGGSGYLINLVVFDALTELLSTPHALAAIGAFAVAVTNNFLWNRRWTFAAEADPAGFQAARFLVVSIASLGMNLAVLELLVGGHAVPELTAQAIAVAVAMPFNFAGNKLWTFA